MVTVTKVIHSRFKSIVVLEKVNVRCTGVIRHTEVVNKHGWCLLNVN